MLKALNLLLLPVSLSALFSQHARAETVDKSSYNLFNPTPSDKLREMSTDRPDATEGAGTVDAGHFQLETDIFNQSRNKDKASGVKTTTTSIGSSNIRMGLTDSTELNVIFDPHVEAKSEVNGKSETVSGFGDTTLRLKLNFMGNEGGPIAIGLIPFVKIPTAKDELGNDKYEGGVILPIGLSLPEEWELGYMVQYN